jgi:hypothetical protein
MAQRERPRNNSSMPLGIDQPILRMILRNAKYWKPSGGMPAKLVQRIY